MAVTYYNQTVLGGTSAPRYPDPLVTGAPNADGLYPWSAFRARISNIVDGAVVTVATSVIAPELLLFISDELALGYFQDVAISAIEAPLTPCASIGFFLNAPSGTPVTRSAGQVASGYVATGTANIRANGFMTTGPAAPVKITEDATDLVVFANSPNICSPVSLQNWDTVLTATAAVSGALPIILAYTAYTQAIRNAGNIFVSTSGLAAGTTYQVVGLINPAPSVSIDVG